MNTKFTFTNLIVIFLLMAGCTSAYQAPVGDIDEPRFLDSDRIHRVNEGETLYSVAWIYDLDFMHIARVNNLFSPYTIFQGQILNVDPRAEQAAPGSQPSVASRQSQATTASSSRSSTAQPAATATRSPTTGTPARTTPVRVQQGPVSWGWPAQGAIVGNFSAAGVENKGIDISGNKGDPVMAAADGEVVYAGSGLLRYGDLVIIKHNDRYLSAYAHNSALLVGEGESVRRGQKIAELGSTGIDRDMLHFEIREEGQPVDPLGHLPPKS